MTDRNYIRVYQHHRFRLYQHGFRSVGFDADCGAYIDLEAQYRMRDRIPDLAAQWNRSAVEAG